MLRKLLEDFQVNIIGRVILVYNRYSQQSVCKWAAASEQSEIVACNVIQFLTIKIYFGIIL